MTVCEQCGAPSQPGESFCGACGAYLEWQETPAEDAGPTAPNQPANPGPADRGTPAPGNAADPEKAPRGRPDAGQADRDAAQPSPAEAEGRTAAPASAPATTAAPASAPPTTAAPVTAAPVRPGVAAPRTRRRELPPEDRRPLPGETICPDCGAGNVHTRRFCRRCGADLVDAPVVPELPWYRRILRRREKPARVAGARPTRRRGLRGLDRRATLLLLMAVVLAGGWFGRSRAMEGVDLVRDRLSHGTVRATAFSASSQARGHPAEAVGDDAPNIYWSPRPTGRAKGEFVTMTLEDPVRLAYVKVFNGSTSEPGKAFASTARVKSLRLTMSQGDGGVETRTIALEDAAGGQDFHIGVDDVVAVRVTVLDAYGAVRGKRVALGEVELVRRT